MITDGEREGSRFRRVWKQATGIVFLATVALTIYSTRDLDPRSWLSHHHQIDRPHLPGWLDLLLGPWKFVVLFTIAGLFFASETGRGKRNANDGTSSTEDTDDTSDR